MSSRPVLHQLLDQTAGRFPAKVAVHDPGHEDITYGDLARLSDLVRDRLLHLGVRPGDRVGIYLPKSTDSVAAIFGILKIGAAYVPVDPGSPPWRAAYILNDCAVRAVFVERAFLDGFTAELTKLGGSTQPIILENIGGGRGLTEALELSERTAPASPGETVYPSLENLAYILYTSGSTGKPKGVMLSHQAAVSFVDWCSETFDPRADDTFSSHAPFHFDLSILDLYVPIKHGAGLVLIGEEEGKEPVGLAQLIARHHITVWYSTPSILSLLAQYGRLERSDLSALRLVLFAGEVFPVPQLRAVKALLPRPRYFNLYGPTETNVCTFHEIPTEVPPERTDPFPIGKTCSHLCSRVIEPDDSIVDKGEEGELVIAGPGIMSGYWNLPDRNAQAFLRDPDGTPWYKTGDLVVEEADGVFLFHGRRDRMVKRRGYRVELGEIEAGLATHASVREVAVVALPDPDSGVRIKAYLGVGDGQRPSIIELKRYCTERLPRYMIPDGFGFLAVLPRTSTDKIDYQSLKAMG